MIAIVITAIGDSVLSSLIHSQSECYSFDDVQEFITFMETDHDDTFAFDN